MKVITVEDHVILTPNLDPVPFWLIIESDGHSFATTDSERMRFLIDSRNMMWGKVDTGAAFMRRFAGYRGYP